MQEQLITYETAKLTKEKGFKVDCNYFFSAKYSKEECIYTESSIMNRYLEDDEYSAPTQSLLQKWLRDNYNLSVVVDDFITNGKIRFDYVVKPLGDQDTLSCEEAYETYEQALEKGLQEALKLI